MKGKGICAHPEMLETRKGNISELPSPTIPPNFHVNKEDWHLRKDFSAKTVETLPTHGKGKEETSLEPTGQFIGELCYVKQTCTENTPVYSEIMG